VRIPPAAGRDLSSSAWPWQYKSQLCSVRFYLSSADVQGTLGACRWSVKPPMLEQGEGGL